MITYIQYKHIYAFQTLCAIRLYTVAYNVTKASRRTSYFEKEMYRSILMKL